MDAPKSSAYRALPEDRRATLTHLEDRYRHELMGEEERLEIRERILRIRRKAGRA